MTSEAMPHVRHRTTGSIRRGGVRESERALAPDLARGAMLLLITVSNTVFYLWAAEHGATGWHPVDGSLADRIAQFVMIAGLDMRVYPMFAFLFGYGMMRLFLRQVDAGTSPRSVQWLLTRRSIGLLLLGAAHAALLLAGDILGVYAFLSLLFAWVFLRRKPRTQLIAAMTLIGLLVLATLDAARSALAGASFPAFPPGPVQYASGEPSWLVSISLRLETWAGATVGGGLLGLSFQAAILLGFWAAQRGVLDNPGEHLSLLRWTAVLGCGIAWLGGLPTALGHLGVVEVPKLWLVETGPLFMVQSATGLAGGLGYAAVFGLLAHRWKRSGHPPSRFVTAIAAAGRRSLSCYVASSVLFSPMLAAWGLGWGQYFGSALMVGYGCLVWTVTVTAAVVLDRVGLSGPGEAFLRWLTYLPTRSGKDPARGQRVSEAHQTG